MIFWKRVIGLLLCRKSDNFFIKKKLPSLEGVIRVLDRLGRPDQSFDWRVIIGGTAGKGSTGAYCEQTLLSQGKKVAVLSSPEVFDVRERIRIGGKNISEECFWSSILKIKEVSITDDIELTAYEALVLAGIWAAKESGAEILVGEIGMGGRLDAVNAIEGKRIAILTFIGEDHLEFFDHDISVLAKEKAGIFTADSVLNVSFEKNFQDILEAQAHGPVDFEKGITAKMNKKLARRACEKILETSDLEMVSRDLPGRWQKVSHSKGDFIFDGAHSAPRFEYLLPKIKKLANPVAILAMTKGHKPEDFKVFSDYFSEIFWVSGSTDMREFWDPEDLVPLVGKGSVCNNFSEALERAHQLETKIFVGGSFYLAEDVKGFI